MKTAGLVTAGVLSGWLMSYGWAAAMAPTEHKALEVEELRYVPEGSISAQVDLAGRKLLLRRITIMPGGQIAKHSHETVPGVVHVASGTWIEGRADGEVEHSAGDTFIEDKDTVHWFYNRGMSPPAPTSATSSPRAEGSRFPSGGPSIRRFSPATSRRSWTTRLSVTW